MSYATVLKAVRKRFSTMCEKDAGGTVVLPTEYPNQDFERPDKGMWARFTILDGEGQQVSFGAVGDRRFRETNYLFIQLFGEVDKGTGEQEDKAAEIAAVFRATTAEGVLYRVPKCKTAGRDGNWWQINVICPFQTDEVA